jgi:hypothetical protein
VELAGDGQHYNRKCHTHGSLAAKERKERKERTLYFYALFAFFRG